MPSAERRRIAAAKAAAAIDGESFTSRPDGRTPRDYPVWDTTDGVWKNAAGKKQPNFTGTRNGVTVQQRQEHRRSDERCLASVAASEVLNVAVLEAQRGRVRTARCMMAMALHDCVACRDNQQLCDEARVDASRRVCQCFFEQSSDGSAGTGNGSPCDGTEEWDAQFQAVADTASSSLELWQIEWLLKPGNEDSDAHAVAWDEWLAYIAPYVLSNSHRKYVLVTGRGIHNFLLSEQRRLRSI